MGKRLSVECTKGTYWERPGRSVEINWFTAASINVIWINLIKGGVHEDLVLKSTKFVHSS